MSDQAVASSRMIGEIFVERGLVTREQLDEALALQARDGGLIGEILVASFGVSRLELATVLAEQWREIEHQDGDPVPAAAPVEQPVVALPSPEPEQARRPLGEIFVASGAITEDDLERALATQRETGDRLGEILVAQGAIGRLELASALAEQWSELQVIRPPQPKEPEPWQETAIRAATEPPVSATPGTEPSTSDAQPPASAPPVPVAVSVDIAGLVDAVAELDTRVTELARRQLPDIDAVRSEASALAGRLEEMDARLGRAADRPAVDGLAESLDELRSRIEAVDRRVESASDLRTAVEVLAARVDQAEQRAPDDRLEALSASLAAVVARLDELGAGRDDLRAVVAGLERRLGEIGAADELRAASFEDRMRALEEQPDARAELDGLRGALDELRDAVATARDGLVTESELASALARLAASEDVPGTDLDAVARLESDLGHVAQSVEALRIEAQARAGLVPRVDALEQGEDHRLDAVWSALEALRNRLDGPDATGDELRAALDALRARVDELQVAATDVAAIHDRLAALEARPADTSAIEEIATRLDVLARGAARSEDVDALRAAIDAEVEQLRATLHRGDADRVDALETALATLADRVEVLAAEARVEELGLGHERLAELTDGLAARVEHVETTLAGTGSLAATIEELDGRLASLAARLDELAAGSGRTDELEAALRAELDRTRAALDALSGRVEEIGQIDSATLMAETVNRAEVAALAGDLHRRVDELESEVAEAARTSRLDAVEGRLGEVDATVAAHAHRLGEMAERVERSVGRDEVERAIAERVAASSAELSMLLDERAAEATDRLARLEHGLEDAHGHAARAADDVRVALRADIDGVVGRLVELARELADAQARAEQGTGAVRDELEARLRDVVARGELDERLAETVARDELEHRLGDAVRRGELDERLADTVAREELEHRLGEVASRAEVCGLADELGTRIGTVEGRSTGLAARLEEELVALGARVEENRAGLVGREEHALAVQDLAARLAALEHAVHEVDQRAAQAAETAGATLHERLASLATRVELDDVWARVVAGEETAAELSRRADHAPTQEQLRSLHDELVRRGDEQRAALAVELAGRLDQMSAELGAGLAALHTRVDELAAGLGHAGGRLVAVEEALPAPGLVDELRVRVEQVHRQVEEEGSLADQRARATERALRKGLAGLGERLVASEEAYVEAGSALRRSIERLGAAVVEADARLADEPLDPPAVGFVAFVPTAEGYRLTALDGPVPAEGATVEAAELDGPHRVTRVTRSPLPLDRRACAYLERVG